MSLLVGWSSTKLCAFALETDHTLLESPLESPSDERKEFEEFDRSKDRKLKEERKKAKLKKSLRKYKKN